MEADLPCTSKTGGEEEVGYPFGQVKADASISASTEKGASPSKTNAGACRLVVCEEAADLTQDKDKEKVRNLMTDMVALPDDF